MTIGCVAKTALWTEHDAERRNVRSHAERRNEVRQLSLRARIQSV